MDDPTDILGNDYNPDAADGGGDYSGNTTALATSTTPGTSGTGTNWLTSLLGIANAGVTTYGTITNSQTAAQLALAKQNAANASASTTSATLAKVLPWVIGAVIIALVGFITLDFFRKGK